MVEPLSVSGVTVIQRVSYGNRLREILAYAEGNPTDLIVMSSRRLDISESPTGFATLSHQVARLESIIDVMLQEAENGTLERAAASIRSALLNSDSD